MGVPAVTVGPHAWAGPPRPVSVGAVTSADASTAGLAAGTGVPDGPGIPEGPGAPGVRVAPGAPPGPGVRGALPAPVVAVAGTAALVAAGAMCWSGLNHDVRYVLGGMRVSGRAGFPASGVFVHRPLAYRWLLSGLDHLTGGPVAVREAWTRALVIVLTVALAWWLRRGLGRFLPRREATAVAVAVGAVLVYAPAWDFLQPEWVAAWLAVASLAAGLALRRTLVAAGAAGVLAALAVLVKYTTAPTALLPLGALVVLDRRRGWWAAAAAALATPAGFVLAIAVQPREWRWFNELSALNPDTPVQQGLHAADLRLLAQTVGTEALMNPAVALLPAAVLLLARGAATRRARWAWPLLTGAGVAGVLVALVVQGQWFQYHLAALPVLGAALCGLAAARTTRGAPHRVPPVLVAAALLLGVAVPLAAARPLPWRTAHGTAAYVLLSVVVAGTLVAAWRAGGARPAGAGSDAGAARTARAAGAAPGDGPAAGDADDGRTDDDRADRNRADGNRADRVGDARRRVAAGATAWAAGVAALLAVAIPAWPTTPYSFDTRHAGFTALERAHDRRDLDRWLDSVRDRIGPDTSVTYLAFGDVAYLLGNPTHCRYPTPDFLQRTRYDREITAQVSYREDLRCVADPAARFAVLDTSWFPLPAVAPEVADTIRAHFACGRPVAAYPRFHLVVCPRR